MKQSDEADANMTDWVEYWKRWESWHREPEEQVELLCEELEIEGYGFLKAELESCRDLHGNLVERLRCIAQDKRHGMQVRTKLQELVDDWGYE